MLCCCFWEGWRFGSCLSPKRESMKKVIESGSAFLNELVAVTCCGFALKALYLKKLFSRFLWSIRCTFLTFFFFSFDNRIQCKLQIWRSFSCWKKWSLQSHTIWSNWTLQSSQQYLGNSRAAEESSWAWIWNLQVKKLENIVYHDTTSVVITFELL